MKPAFQYLTLLCTGLVLLSGLKAQPGSSVELTKPPKYEKRVLASEKTGQKKFGPLRHFYQNTITHYNYYFNANNRLNGIVDRAKQAFRDDFTQLLPFYNYSLDNTAQESQEIDTIIYKCTAGVLLHDLRNDWVDNLYLVLGRAYFLRKNFDSSEQVFKYINYAFAPKDDGYDIPIGSNISNNEGIFTVATKEDRDFWKKMTSHTPSRNVALLWLVRNYIERGEMTEAAGLLEILKSDPYFPPRLQGGLQEMTAYWFYEQQVADSAAVHLTLALDNAANSQEKARWEYLIAQLYQMSNDNEKANEFYTRSASHTLDPIMEVYATLNSIKVKGGDEAALQDKLNNLLKLAKKEKFALNRDIIYYAVAQVALQMQQYDQAQQLLLKSVANSADNPAQRSLSFLLLGDLNYDRKLYIPSHNFYDSVEEAQIKRPADQARLKQRKPSLATIAGNIQTIHLQDSLQHLASMPAEEREAAIKKLLRQLRKQQGLKEDKNGNFVNPAVQGVQAPDLFADNKSSGSASDWYFNNNSLKSGGFTEFRSRWGDRPNVDNWNRKAAIDQLAKDKVKEIDIAAGVKKDSAALATGLTLEAMTANIPLTPEKMEASNDKIAKALFSNGQTFQDQLQDYPSAIETYLELLRRFPQSALREEVLFNLYYCYRRNNQLPRADSALAALKGQNPDSKWLHMLNQENVAENSEKNPATRLYRQIYDTFLEGQFETAKNEKKKADSVYGKSYWSPQLLYIESVYYIKQREDSTAISRLTDLKQMYASSPLAEKAAIMIDVLKRRKEIEAYLTNLQVTRNEDDMSHPILADSSELGTLARARKGMGADSLFSSGLRARNQGLGVDNFAPHAILADSSAIGTYAKARESMKKDSLLTGRVDARGLNVNIRKDTTPIVKINQFSYNPDEPQYAVLVLDKVDPVYANEARNAFNRFNRDRFYNEKIDVGLQKLDDRYSLLLLGPFVKAYFALDYLDKTKPYTQNRIIPWLTTNKYSYAIISQANLDLLRQNKDLDTYKKVLHQALPDKF
jgi:outer membrane protein assembly factor BamD (BamD/ComL family)